ncbi:MAG: hypothetical protein ACTSYZ_14935 [Candidatus Helarchaeota archaeon]
MSNFYNNIKYYEYENDVYNKRNFNIDIRPRIIVEFENNGKLFKSKCKIDTGSTLTIISKLCRETLFTKLNKYHNNLLNELKKLKSKNKPEDVIEIELNNLLNRHKIKNCNIIHRKSPIKNRNYFIYLLKIDRLSFLDKEGNPLINIKNHFVAAPFEIESLNIIPQIGMNTLRFLKKIEITELKTKIFWEKNIHIDQ